MQEIKLFKKITVSLVEPDTTDTLIRLLQAWRLWIVAIVAGSVLGGLAYLVFPPPYQAQSTVIVDHNVSEVWYPAPDRYVWNYLTSEVVKLREVAWSDEVLQGIVDQVPDISMDQLRSDILVLTYVNDGPWHLVVNDQYPERAKTIANIWAESFIEQVRDNMGYSIEMELLRVELINLYDTQEYSGVIKEKADEIYAKINEQEKTSNGVSPYLDLYLSEDGSVLNGLASSKGEYIFAGAISGIVLAVFYAVIARRQF